MNETLVAARPEANTAQPDLGSHQGAPAGRMVVRRLRGRRHDAADRRRAVMRSHRYSCRPKSARCRGRQRQRVLGGGASRLRCDCDRLRTGPTGQARERAAAERLQIDFREADAEALPFKDRSFDVVVSTFGVMFTPDQPQAAAEMIRVCKPGGKIGLANWTPDGFIGQLFKTIGTHVPPPAGVKSPALWGTRARIEELFGSKVSAITAEPRNFVFRYRSPQHCLDVFRTYYGPLLKAFAALQPEAQASLATDVIALIERFNRSGDASMVVPSEYLEVVITL